MSPPSTPTASLSPRLPLTTDQFRFEDTGYPSEWAEDYRPGGLHPVELGDELSAGVEGRGRYRVVRKLGYGSYSTVWLARDTQCTGPSRFVAVKILRADVSLRGSEREVEIYSFLKGKAQGEYVVPLMDSWEIEGPNGRHKCLVFEPMGPTAASMLEKLPCNRLLPPEESPRYPVAMARGVLKHVLQGLRFLHGNGVVHGDVQPGNMLFSCADLSFVGEEELRQPEEKISPPLKRVDGKTDRWAPRYLAVGASLVEYVDFDAPMMVKLSDLGSAFWSTDPPSSTVTPVALRAPELIFHEPFGSGIDIWAFGCLIYEFLTGIPLCSVVLIGNDDPDDADDDHILDLIDILGPLPETLMSKWPRRNLWFGPNGERIQPASRGGSGSGEPFISDSLEVLFERYRPDDMDVHEARVVTELIRAVLRFDPKERPSAEEVLRHPWFGE